MIRTSNHILEEIKLYEENIELQKKHIAEHKALLKKKYKCVICDKICGSLVYYEKHLIVHQDRAQCNICLKYFEDKEALNEHLVMGKNGLNGCRCQIVNMKGQQCRAILTSRNNYRQHHGHSRAFTYKYNLESEKKKKLLIAEN